MVNSYVKHLYSCEVCEVTYDRFHLAKKCETSHNQKPMEDK